MGTTTSKHGAAAVHTRSGRMAKLPGDAPAFAPPRDREEAVRRNSVEVGRSSESFRRTGSSGSAGLAPRLSIDSNRSCRGVALPGDSRGGVVAAPLHILRAASRGSSFNSTSSQ